MITTSAIVLLLGPVACLVLLLICTMEKLRASIASAARWELAYRNCSRAFNDLTDSNLDLLKSLNSPLYAEVKATVEHVKGDGFESMRAQAIRVGNMGTCKLLALGADAAKAVAS